MTISFLAANQIKQALKSKCTGCGPSYRNVVNYPLAQFNFRPTGKVEDNHINQKTFSPEVSQTPHMRL